MPVDASMLVSTTDARVQETYSFGVPHTRVCVTFDKFTTMICLFFVIVKYNILVFLQVAVPYFD